jgi:4-hydroxy-tetrahydrodipicolinate synthase
MIKNLDFKGVFAVPCTPFDEDDAIDEAVLRRHLRFLLDEGGVHGIVPTGSTGEFAFQSREERSRVMEITLDEVAGKVPVLPGATGVSTRETIQYAQAAERAGADGVMILSPYYGHPDQEELYQHFAAVAQSVNIPIMLYNNPASGCDMLPPLIARLAQFDTIQAIKESTGEMQRVAAIMRTCENKIKVLCGCDTLPMEMFLMGVEGWVAAPANVIPRKCVDLYELCVEKKEYSAAWDLYRKIVPLFTLFETSGKYVQLSKAALEMIGRPIGLPRLPFLPANDAYREQIRAILDGIFDL